MTAAAQPAMIDFRGVVSFPSLSLQPVTASTTLAAHPCKIWGNEGALQRGWRHQNHELALLGPVAAFALQVLECAALPHITAKWASAEEPPTRQSTGTIPTMRSSSNRAISNVILGIHDETP
jgi:hypothetical protein